MPSLSSVLEKARSLGFLGPGPLSTHIEQGHAFSALVRPADGRLIDIGSGGGVPGLIVAEDLPELDIVLVDASQRRCSFLVWAAIELGFDSRVDVRCSRVEDLVDWRDSFDVLTARGFGKPSEVAEVGSPLIVTDGHLIVSDPPGGRAWPEKELMMVGLTVNDDGFDSQEFALSDLDKSYICSYKYPRSRKLRQSNPLF